MYAVCNLLYEYRPTYSHNGQKCALINHMTWISIKWLTCCRRLQNEGSRTLILQQTFCYPILHQWFSCLIINILNVYDMCLVNINRHVFTSNSLNIIYISFSFIMKIDKKISNICVLQFQFKLYLMFVECLFVSCL